MVSRLSRFSTVCQKTDLVKWNLEITHVSSSAKLLVVKYSNRRSRDANMYTGQPKGHSHSSVGLGLRTDLSANSLPLPGQVTDLHQNPACSDIQ